MYWQMLSGEIRVVDLQHRNIIKIIKLQLREANMRNQIPYRGSSATRLPPISKYSLNRPKIKQKIKGIDLSLQLLHNYSRPIIFSNGSSSRVKKPNSNSKVRSSRHRTDSIGSQLNVKLQHNSFDAPTPSSMVQKNPELTLQNFHKNIKINKQYIHREIKRRKIQARESKQNEAVKTEQDKTPNKEPKHRNPKRSMTEDSAIFEDIQQIINSKMTKNRLIDEENEKLNLNQVRHIIKISKLNKNIKKLSPKQSIKGLHKYFEEQSLDKSSMTMLKDENNYHEWRRVYLSSKEASPEYKLSTFESENERLQQFVAKNQISLSDYLQYRKELFAFQPAKVKTSSS